VEFGDVNGADALSSLDVEEQDHEDYGPGQGVDEESGLGSGV
jgi:hypothetical protein